MTTEELRRLAEAATPGPWEVLEVGVDELFVVKPDGGGGCWFLAEMSRDGDFANASFIAACDPQTVLALLARLDAAYQEARRG